jgi:FkbM family methyltransferase
MTHINENLIFDIGLHTGRDTEFYLRKGFKVIAVEANPEIAEKARRVLSPYEAAGTLSIVEKALYERSGEHVTFHVNDEKDDWSSLFKGCAEKGMTSSRPITVETICLDDLYQKYGVPYYLKCDIEGCDELVAQQLSRSEVIPTFASFEITSVPILGVLWSAGYRKFQLINQGFNYLTVPPDPAREGIYVQHGFDGHTSGLFGKELNPARWVDIEQITGLYMDFSRLRDRYEQLCMGWLDVHATL